MHNIEKLQKNLNSSIEAALITDASNRFYLTGMKSSAGTVLVTADKAWFLIDFRYLEEAERGNTGCRVIEEKDKYRQVAEILGEEGIGRLCVVSPSMSVSECRGWKESNPGLCIDDSDILGNTLERVRQQKDEEEIHNHRTAQRITDEAFTHILGFIRPGITELDIARELGTTMEKNKSDDRHYHYIVASGPNGSLPHGFATDRVIRSGDLITMDYGAVVGGYFADMTRTVAVGKVSEEQKKIYGIVKEAQERAFEQIRPGAVCSDVDAAAREYIYSCGYEGCFSHGLGHAVGIDVHENPRFNETCRELLRPGNVMTVEPGIYVKHRMGVRIEDMVVIREGGFENLTKSSRELIIL